jgi:hypothetical protein
MRICIVTILQILLLTGSAYAGRTIEGMVRAVYDGDTVLLTTRGKNRLKVRRNRQLSTIYLPTDFPAMLTCR